MGNLLPPAERFLSGSGTSTLHTAFTSKSAKALAESCIHAHLKEALTRWQLRSLTWWRRRWMQYRRSLRSYKAYDIRTSCRLMQRMLSGVSSASSRTSLKPRCWSACKSTGPREAQFRAQRWCLCSSRFCQPSTTCTAKSWSFVTSGARSAWSTEPSSPIQIVTSCFLDSATQCYWQMVNAFGKHVAAQATGHQNCTLWTTHSKLTSGLQVS
mmetsp:Transcript_149949/g.272958  ORF Transcript_149949/g.272958 Transcript_149949/m.272958 type:complete len:212 (+) Transcript_149949:1228-1863(+)